PWFEHAAESSPRVKIQPRQAQATLQPAESSDPARASRNTGSDIRAQSLRSKPLRRLGHDFAQPSVLESTAPRMHYPTLGTIANARAADPPHRKTAAGNAPTRLSNGTRPPA